MLCKLKCLYMYMCVLCSSRHTATFQCVWDAACTSALDDVRASPSSPDTLIHPLLLPSSTLISLSLSLQSFSSLGDLSSIVWGVFQSLDRQTDECMKDCVLIPVTVWESIGAYTWSELSETSSLKPERFDWQLLNQYKSPERERERARESGN